MSKENIKLYRLEDAIRRLKKVSDSDTYLYGQGQSHAYDNVLKLIAELTN